MDRGNMTTHGEKGDRILQWEKNDMLVYEDNKRIISGDVEMSEYKILCIINVMKKYNINNYRVLVIKYNVSL